MFCVQSPRTCDTAVKTLDLWLGTNGVLKDSAVFFMRDIIYFLDCLKQEFKLHSIVGKAHNTDLRGHSYTYPNCTIPWHQSMLGIFAYNDTEVKECNAWEHGMTRDERWDLYLLDYDFMKKAITSNTTCLGKFYINLHL